MNFCLTSGAVEAVQPGACWYSHRAHYNNYTGLGDWNPRIGIAWTPRFMNGKTVVRAGYGSSAYLEGGGSNEELSLNLPFVNGESTYTTGIGKIGASWHSTPLCPAPQD